MTHHYVWWMPFCFHHLADSRMHTIGWRRVHTTGTAAITYVVPQVKYNGGDYPTTPLEDGKAPFVVDTKIFLHAAQDGIKGTVTVTGEWGDSKSQAVTLHAGENNLTITLVASSPNIWWANGMGSQPLYNLTATFHALFPTDNAAAAAAAAPTVVRRIGFRHVVLATFNDTNATWVSAALKSELQGNGDHTLMFRMNGNKCYPAGV